jgi:hypothetical protein
MMMNTTMSKNKVMQTRSWWWTPWWIESKAQRQEMTMQVSFALINVDRWLLNTQSLLYFGTILSNWWHTNLKKLVFKSWRFTYMHVGVCIKCAQMECPKDNYNSLVMGGMLSYYKVYFV